MCSQHSSAIERDRGRRRLFQRGWCRRQVANYGLKDGKVFDFISRTTPAPGGKDEGVLKSLFRNLGKKQLFGE
jgi:hypothetical protein